MPESASSRWANPAVTLIATDLNDLDRLMPFVLAQSAGSGTRLILLHVLTGRAVLATDAAGLPYYDPAGALEYAERAMEPWCEQARRHGVACDALVREGAAIHQIESAARQFHADRVVVGTRSRSKLGKLLVGSVAEQVLRSVNLPVMTVGPEAHLAVEDAGAGGEQATVLYATQLRETSRPSAALACQIAAGMGARLLLLHVLPPGEAQERSGMPAGMDSAALHELRKVAAETGANCCMAVEPLVMHGNPSVEILATASERNARLIVLGATQRSALENLTRDRTVYRVLAHARCPVLTLREPLVAEDWAVGAAMAGTARG
jgi:nucleotide-binding universal stress UspA family protein